MRSSKPRSRNKNNRNRSNNSVGNVVNRVFDSSGPEGKVRGTPQQIIDKYNQLARDASLANDRVNMENFQQHAEHYMRMLGEATKEQDQRREQQERENRERQAQRDRERSQRDGDGGGQNGNQNGGQSNSQNNAQNNAQNNDGQGAKQDNARQDNARQGNTPSGNASSGHQGDQQAEATTRDSSGNSTPSGGRPRSTRSRQRDPGESPQPDIFDVRSDDDGPGLVDTPESRAEQPVKPKPVEETAQAPQHSAEPQPGTTAGDAPKAEEKPKKPRAPRKPSTRKKPVKKDDSAAEAPAADQPAAEKASENPQEKPKAKPAETPAVAPAPAAPSSDAAE